MGYIGVITYNPLIPTFDPNFLGHPKHWCQSHLLKVSASMTFSPTAVRFEKAVGIDTRSRVVGAAFDQELQVATQSCGGGSWVAELCMCIYVYTVYI